MNKKYTFSQEEIGVVKPVSFASHLKSKAKDKNFVQSYKKLDPEYALVRAIVDARQKKNISQKKLASLLGTGQSAISRLESGTYNPTFSFVQKLAHALDTDLVITFSK